MRHFRSVCAALAIVATTAFTPAQAERVRPQPMPDAMPSEYRPLPRQDTVLVGATILDGAGGKHVGDVLMRDGRIVAVGSDLQVGDAKRIDATGKWITPGLIDVHTHYGTYLMPQGGPSDWSDVTEASSTNGADAWVEHAVRSSDPAFGYALASGVTTAQILPGSSVLISGRSVVVHTIPMPTVAQMKFPNAPQGLKMACGGNSVNEDSFPTSRQGQIAGLEQYLREGQAFLDSDGDAGQHPKEATIAGAIEGRIPVHLHCYRADDIATWIAVLKKHGIKLGTVHHATEAYKIAPLLAREGICSAVWPDWWGFKREAEDGIAENAAFLEAAGACVVMHSDIPLLGGLLNVETAKAAASGRRAGIDIPPEKAIRWITSNAARSLGLEDRIGTIAKGMNADIVVWSGDPFSVFSKPDLVFIDGAVAFDRNDPDRQPLSDFELGQPQREGM
ncbi:amidohydrolase family protein [Croceicoccus naphthovorans]|uniref:Uncharacterized protein n=1 Tax=Croceicoccus naphthovorans TaxID=1348774 RepID=A0A0G3XFT1_9SPHN|nr:amidohydrolase family protein [Croceicoccus naphthovorans]AKM09484.1 hypothetical protein AB433_05005 [Croceicoccus naphthovorans]MBB3991505.1 imidazolonepropionase-like amidohydrolase [Croceicoccus naphthovorans]